MRSVVVRALGPVISVVLVTLIVVVGAPLRALADPTSFTVGYAPLQNPPVNDADNPHLGPCGYSYPQGEAPACTALAVAAVDNDRAQEGLPALVLPANWQQLTPVEQLFVVLNIERVTRGEHPFLGINSTLDAAAASAAAAAVDPTLPPGFPALAWGSTWAGVSASPVSADIGWLYQDGPGPNGGNLDCTHPGEWGCWGHRDVDLMHGCAETYCIFGGALDPTGYQANGAGWPSWTQLLVQAPSPQPLTFTWAAEVPYFPPGALSPPGPEGESFSGIASAPGGQGYWLTTSAGATAAFGSAPNDGSASAAAGGGLAAPIVSVVADPDGQGYWEVGADGGVFAFGGAGFYGSVPGLPAGERPPSGVPVVGLVPTPDGQGYWEVTSAGDVYSFGDAGFYGSTGDTVLAAPVVGMAAAPGGQGYWLVGADGGVFSFGDASYLGRGEGMSDSSTPSPKRKSLVNDPFVCVRGRISPSRGSRRVAEGVDRRLSVPCVALDFGQVPCRWR